MNLRKNPKINEIKNMFFEKLNNFDKTHSENPNKQTRNEKDAKADTIEKQRIM